MLDRESLFENAVWAQAQTAEGHLPSLDES
jgi:hypothetical protein